MSKLIKTTVNYYLDVDVVEAASNSDDDSEGTELFEVLLQIQMIGFKFIHLVHSIN